MAETAISVVLSKLGELATNEATILLEVGDNMAQLRDRLEWLQAFVRDADRKRRAGTDQLTRVWVRQTRDVAFEAEDALDDFFYEVDLESKGYHGWKLCHEFLTSFYTQIVVRHGLSTRIKKINTRLETISENQKEYKIEHTPLAPMASSTIAFSAWSNLRLAATVKWWRWQLGGAYSPAVARRSEGQRRWRGRRSSRPRWLRGPLPELGEGGTATREHGGRGGGGGCGWSQSRGRPAARGWSRARLDGDGGGEGPDRRRRAWRGPTAGMRGTGGSE